MTEDQSKQLSLLSREIVETDRLIEQERNSDVMDVPYLRELKARAAALKAEAQRYWSRYGSHQGQTSS